MRCDQCVYWTEPPKRIGKQAKFYYMGECRQMNYTDKAHIPMQGCVECDPYSMNDAVIETRADFGCVLFKEKKG